MTTPFSGVGDLAGLTAAAAALTGTRRGLVTTAKVVGVDVEARPTIAKIIRAGEEIEPPILNPGRVEDLVSRLVPIIRVRVPRCVSQSIPAGTRVARGTPVDLVVVPVGDVDFGLFDRVHEDFKLRTVESMLGVIAEPVLDPILKKGTFADLTDQDKTIFRDRMGNEGITFDDANPTRSTEIAFLTMKNAKAFQ